MKISPLQNKTIRPGSLNGYSYYYSGRQAPPPAPKAKRKLPSFKLLVIPVVLLALIGIPLVRHNDAPATKQPSQSKAAPAAVKKETPAAVVAAPPINRCEGNTQSKLIKVSVDQRHLWACEASKQVYDTPVITGLKDHPETETPLGTYHIYGKTTNTTLKGSDSRGSWNDPVYYWMPFLTNQYGTYGFHDATWRPDTAFGNVDPTSQDASHGCIELPLASSKWLYEWAPIRTTVIVES
ncbi:MAG TPA: L,D-transpeptidase family protein [Methylomirabilota bacterium]|nr:L,D-transpeptidase family protein [Methylomirabilota bacterium]